MSDDLRNDDDLLEAVRQAFARVPPIPPAVSDFARHAFDWASLDAELAELTLDTGVELSPGLRSNDANERALTYTSNELEVELTILLDAAVGQVTPLAEYEILLQTASGEVATTSDERGRFRFPAFRLPARLAIRSRAGRVVTPWLTA